MVRVRGRRSESRGTSGALHRDGVRAAASVASEPSGLIPRSDDPLVAVTGDLTESGVGRARAARYGVLGSLVVLIATALLLFGSEPVLPGGQVVGPAAQIGNAAAGGWEQMPPADGQGRAGFPEPMVQVGTQLCVGFGRVDFPSDDRRPSLARCIERSDLPRGRELLVVLASTDSGYDTWHFLAVGGVVEDVEVVETGGNQLDGSRIHVGGPLIALRLADGTGLESIEWETDFGRFTCSPAPDAWSTARFCS